jgi:hypothetical protein
MLSTRKCAFCNGSGKLTREHIWPRCIIERTPSYNARYLGQIETFFEGDLTVKDVCVSCNNGPLSALDNYICELYDAHFSRIAAARQPRNFVFDSQQLFRWLLKASYNSARANQTDTDVLARYAPFVLNGGNSPSEFEVRLELIRPSRNPNYRPGTSAPREIPPLSTRCCRIEVPNNPVPGRIIRLVAINSFYFWLIFWPSDADRTAVQETLPGSSIVPNSRKMTLFPRREMLELHANWVLNPKANESMRVLRVRQNRPQGR